MYKPEDKSPQVSVIVPVYNMEKFLPETLSSILASDYPWFEVIVVDDGSTDGSLSVAESMAEGDERVRVLHKENGGVATARNHGIAAAKGIYILPVDADNRISTSFIRVAAEVLDTRPDVKVVAPEAEFFGIRTGRWRLPEFTLNLLARRNIMDTCAMYRRTDWVRVGGYCTTIVAREDWEFWIAMLKDGGEVVRLPEVHLWYRVQEQSKRVSDRAMKRHVVATLNARHPEFFERELGGPLRLNRSWSKLINALCGLVCPRRVVVSEPFTHIAHFVKVLPRLFAADAGKVIFKNRNEIREFEVGGYSVVVKEFRIPNVFNRIIYGLLRPSKAERSYRYAQMLRDAGIGSPMPVGYVTVRHGILFAHSYYASLRSHCTMSYMQLVTAPPTDRDEYLRAIGKTTAALHERGLLHTDYSRGNILLGRAPDGSVCVDLVDLNRIRFRRVDMHTGCRNFERLPANTEILGVMAEAYAEARGFDARECLDIMTRYNSLEIE